MRSGLDLYARDFHPQDVAEIRAWSAHPVMSELLKDLQDAREKQRFLDHYAEAMVALHLLRQGRTLAYEVPTPKGKKADFSVSSDSDVFFVHIKRVNLDQATEKNLRRYKRLDSLRKIGRPVTVSFMPFRSLTDQEMQHCCREARQFIQNAPEGQTKEVLSLSGEVLGELEIGPSHNGQRVRLFADLPAVDGGYDRAIQDQLCAAYQQFMPGFDNVIMVTDFWHDDGSIEDVRDALDEFWRNQVHPMSAFALYFTFDPASGTIKWESFIRNKSAPSHITEMFAESKVTISNSDAK